MGQGCCWEVLALDQKERETGPDLGRRSLMLRSFRVYAVVDGEALEYYSKGCHNWCVLNTRLCPPWPMEDGGKPLCVCVYVCVCDGRRY